MITTHLPTCALDLPVRLAASTDAVILPVSFCCHSVVARYWSAQSALCKVALVRSECGRGSPLSDRESHGSKRTSLERNSNANAFRSR